MLGAALLGYLSIAVLFAFKSIRKDANVAWAVVLAAVCRLAVVLVAGLSGRAVGPEYDSVGFHAGGLHYAAGNRWEFGIGSSFYEQVLGVVYAGIGEGFIIGCAVSAVFMSIANGYFVNLLGQLGVRHGRAALLLLFNLMPAALLLSAMPMREALQVLCFIAAVSYGVDYHLTKRLTSVGYSLGFALLLGLTHNGLILYLGFFLLVLTLWRFGERTAKKPWVVSKVRLVGVSAMAAITLGSLTFLLINPGGASAVAFQALAKGEGLQYAAEYREAYEGARARYGVELDTQSIPSLAISSVPVYVYYHLAPFPWQIENVQDIYAFLESLFRLVLILLSVRAWQEASGVQRQIISFLLILYLSQTFLWALGTINWGTALRHHMKSTWIVLAIGGPVLWRLVMGTRRAEPLACESGTV